MSRSDPFVTVTCDECGGSQQFEMSRSRGWYKEVDEYELENEGWFTNGDDDYCCVDCVQSALGVGIECINCHLEAEIDADVLIEDPSEGEVEDYLLDNNWVQFNGNWYCDKDCARDDNEFYNLVELAKNA